MVTTMHGKVPSVGFCVIAVTTVSDFMMVAELRFSSQALICSSTMLGFASINILTLIGRGISLTPSIYNSSCEAAHSFVSIHVEGAPLSGMRDEWRADAC